MKRLLVPFVALALAGCAIVAGTGPALAHAHLRKAAPAVGSTVHGSPPLLELWFSEELEPAFCTIALHDKSGKKIPTGGVVRATDDRAALIVSLPRLAPGTYQVVWHAVSVDTHKTQGDFTFKVVP